MLCYGPLDPKHCVVIGEYCKYKVKELCKFSNFSKVQMLLSVIHLCIRQLLTVISFFFSKNDNICYSELGYILGSFPSQCTIIIQLWFFPPWHSSHSYVIWSQSFICALTNDYFAEPLIKKLLLPTYYTENWDYERNL